VRKTTSQNIKPTCKRTSRESSLFEACLCSSRARPKQAIFCFCGFAARRKCIWRCLSAVFCSSLLCSLLDTRSPLSYMEKHSLDADLPLAKKQRLDDEQQAEVGYLPDVSSPMGLEFYPTMSLFSQYKQKTYPLPAQPTQPTQENGNNVESQVAAEDHPQLHSERSAPPRHEDNALEINNRRVEGKHSVRLANGETVELEDIAFYVAVSERSERSEANARENSFSVSKLNIEPSDAAHAPTDSIDVELRNARDSASHKIEHVRQLRNPPQDQGPATRAARTSTKITSIDDIMRSWDNLVKPEERALIETAVARIASQVDERTTDAGYQKILHQVQRQLKVALKKSKMLFIARERYDADHAMMKHLITKAGRSDSGVLVITVLTSPYPRVGNTIQTFSCEWNCYYCPNEPAHQGNNWTPQPRSYLHDEPSVLRANRNNFDPVLQFYDRAVTLAMNGHPVDKIELLVLGGTWASYPRQYQETFIRDLFFAANTFQGRTSAQRVWRSPLSLEEEKALNENSVCKIIGITLETRPDTIDLDEIIQLRRYGCTRVQLGLQHTDNAVLKKINRGCTTEQAIEAVRVLKDNCFKIDVHLMPNLPGASPELDAEMFRYLLRSPDLQVDQWKIYPCEVTPWTVIRQWYESGKYVPYPDSELIRVLLDAMAEVHPWIRLNRVIRDIPSQYIYGGIDAPNLRQELEKTLRQQGRACRCIRCREIKRAQVADPTLIIREYDSSYGREYFISYESADQSTIMGFCRLRLCNNDSELVLPELRGAALVRELHVYGKLIPTAEKDSHAQHRGLGRGLMLEAERIARQANRTHVAVIAGVGVRNYYRKLGYELQGTGEFMIKHFEPPPRNYRRAIGVALLGLFVAWLLKLYFK
jgi:ELP3 family radical SAM enzyme/protein acetyltransferase